ncbi:MAG: TIGR03619 family F420-dependent LLM class oxidoreductase [bacterium]|nr:TIGR03619 family F420-dependent LLM class oxidoreductase [bacterium]
MFMVDPAEFLDLARTADGTGWDSIQVADAPFFPEVISVPYPYTPDGTRFWPLDQPVLDPWVAITAMATVTKRIRFIPSVLRLAVRQPLLEAKSLCSVAAMSDDRVALGVGLAWMPEEFKWLGQDKKTRGARQDEAIQILRLLMGGGMVEFHGEYYDFDRLTMAPVPKKRIPIYVGGTTKPALRRAARFGDGWISVIHSMDEVEGLMAELNRFRREFGRENEPFDVMMHCPDAESVDDIRRLEDLGVTDLQVTPWSERVLAEMGVGAIMQQQPSLAVKQAAIERYAEDVIAKFPASTE